MLNIDAHLQSAVLADLAPEARARLAAIATPVDWSEGTIIYREGQADARVYLVEEGRVAIEHHVPGQGPTCILTVGPGDVFGWSALFARRPKQAGARATRPTRALAFDADRLRDLCDADPRLGYSVTRWLLQTVAERLDATRIQLQDLFASPRRSACDESASPRIP